MALVFAPHCAHVLGLVHNATLHVGQRWELACGHRNFANQKKWFLDGRALPFDKKRHRITPKSGLLRLRSVTVQDAGQYTCFPPSHSAEYGNNYTFNIVVEGVTITSVFIVQATDFKSYFILCYFFLEKVRILELSPENETIFFAGERVNLACDVTGMPVPHIHWLHNGKPVSVSHLSHLPIKT